MNSNKMFWEEMKNLTLLAMDDVKIIVHSILDSPELFLIQISGVRNVFVFFLSFSNFRANFNFQVVNFGPGSCLGSW